MKTNMEAPAQPAGVQVRLIGSFDIIVEGKSVPVGISAQRLIGLLTLSDRPLSRLECAATMWPDVMTKRAGANLRSIVWRLQRTCPGLVHASTRSVRIGPEVVVDAKQWSELAYRLIDKSRAMDQDELRAARATNLHADLLPELGDEEWLVAERVRYRQIGLHALEALSERLIAIGSICAALDAGLAAVRLDPLRESGHRVLVSAYLAEGNYCDAYRQFDIYRRLLGAELGVEPSSQFEDLLQQIPRPRQPVSGTGRIGLRTHGSLSPVGVGTSLGGNSPIGRSAIGWSQSRG